MSTSNPETNGTGVTVGEYATFRLNFTIPEGTTLHPRLMLRSWSITTGILYIVNVTLTIPSNMNESSRVVDFSDYNQDSYDDTVVVTFNSLVNHPDNVVNGNDWVLVDIVTLVTRSVINIEGTQLVLSSSLSHSNGTDTIVESTRYSYLIIVQPDLIWDINCNVTEGDAGDVVAFNISIFHSNHSTTAAFNVEVAARLLPYHNIIASSLVVVNANNVQYSAGSGLNALASVSKLLQGEYINITFNTYLDTAVQASSFVSSIMEMKYSTSYDDGRDLYPFCYLIFIFVIDMFI